MAKTLRNNRSKQERLAKIVAAQRGPCMLCHGKLGPIDYETKGRPTSFEADHILPWSIYPEYRYRLDNLQASHKICNARKGNGDRKPKRDPKPIAVTAGLGTIGWNLDD